MNVENLRNNHPKLISYMEAAGYSKDHIGRLQKEIQKILAEADSKDWNCYSDVYKDYKATPLSLGSLGRKRASSSSSRNSTLTANIPTGSGRDLSKGAHTQSW